MLHRDYLVEVVGEFVQEVSRALRRAVAGDVDGVGEVERQVGDILELDHEIALSLAPDSLVTMILLSGVGDSVAAYIRYALDRAADLHEREGNADLAGLRRLQARAVGESFGCAGVPAEFSELDAELFGEGAAGARP